MVKSTSTANLVRPRTAMQDSNQSLGFTSAAALDKQRLRAKRSIIILTLVGTCMFLFILCACLVTALVLVGRTLSMNAALTAADQSQRAFANEQRISTVAPSDSVYLLSIKDFASRIVPSSEPTVSSEAASAGISTTEHSNESTTTGEHTIVLSQPVVDSKSVTNSVKETNAMSAKVSKIISQLGWRLPSSTRPTLYNLLLRPDFKQHTFSGTVSIHLNVSKPISFVAVHSKFLQVTTESLQRNGSNVEVANAFNHPEHEYWVTEVAKPLDIGDYVLNLSFSGNLTGRIVGFYESLYRDDNGTRYIATSKFEPTFARQAFPCFDEPAMKAKFNVSIVRPNDAGYSALSNMNVVNNITNSDNTTTVVFEQSVPMSTYLICFIVSDFVSKQAPVKANGIGKDMSMSVYARPSELDKVDFALDTGARVTEFFIKYFQTEYPLPKLDMVAIPDFVSGAMEHWGLVTFRETALLYDKKSSSASNKQRVASVVAHELAHQWFGNLVTMEWWNELWLNEGFATYLQYKGTHELYPDWKMNDQFITETLHGVLAYDSTLATHPIVQVAENPDQITELFDTITYSKGASVIRMLADFVGDKNFAMSVTKYLAAHKYGNAVTEDLLSQIEAIDPANADVKDIMATWTQQSGYPLVEARKINSTQYKLTQKRFFSNFENSKVKLNDSPFNYRWTIPITYTTSNAPNDVQRAWFLKTDNEIVLTVPADHQWLKLNRDQVGFYRVNYDTDDWTRLSDALLSNASQFSISDRGHLLNDAFSLAAASTIKYDVALNLTKYLNSEAEFVPWSAALSGLGGLRNNLYSSKSYSLFLKYAQQQIEPIYKSVGWTSGDDHTKNLLRSSVLNFACSVGLPDCIATVQTKFNDWLLNGTAPDSDVKSTVYYYGLQTSGLASEANWDKIWKLYVDEKDAQEKIKLLTALAAVQTPWVLARYINYAWNEEHVRRQDYFMCLQAIAANRVGEPLVWDYVREKWPQIVDRFGLNERYLGRLIPSITGRFNTAVKLGEIKEFFAKYPEAGAGAAARKEALENVAKNIKWFEFNEPSVGEWLSHNAAKH